MVVGIVLAAGGSLRMGNSKALLQFGNTTFIRHILDVYTQANVENIVVVLPPSAHSLREHLAGLPLKLVTNENPESGQLSSVIAGLIAAEEFRPDGALIHPVDHPAIGPNVIESLVEGFAKSKRPIIIPTCNGKRGHPVLFSSTMFQELKDSSLDIGARQVVRSHSQEIFEVETNDAGILLNVDSPDDYAKLMNMIK